MPSQSRRRFFRSITVGTGAFVAVRHLPEQWTRPVVDGVVLPVHAQLSPETCCVEYCGFSTDNDNVEVFNASYCDGTVEVIGGGAGPGSWTGSGPAAPDGDFSFVVEPAISDPVEISGNANCNRIIGTFGDSISFEGFVICGNTG